MGPPACSGSPDSAVAVYAGDLYRPLPRELRGRVDVLVVNAPYVPTGEIGLLPSEARDHEPRVALDGGADGLDIQRRVAAEAAHWLAPDGHLLVETGHHQAERTAESLVRGGLVPRVTTAPEWDATVVVGTLPGPQEGPAPGAGAAGAGAPRSGAPEPGAPESGVPQSGTPIS